MKNLNSAMTAWTRCNVIILTLMFIITSLNNSFSQCSLACNGNTQVSLDINCEAEITPEMILNDQSTSCPGGNFYVEVYAQNQYIPTSPVISGDYMGLTIIAEVIDSVSGNSCWGYLTVEDKLGPQIETCPDSVDIDCIELSVYEGPLYVDACEGPVDAILLSETTTAVCNDTYIRYITRVYTAQDSKGWFAQPCTIVYRLLRLDTAAIICPESYTAFEGNSLSCDGDWRPGQGGGTPDTDTNGDGIKDTDVHWDDNNNGYPDPQEIGVPHIVSASGDTIPMFPFTNVYCNAAVIYNDFELPQVDCTRKIMRTWITREWHCMGEVSDTCLQIIEIKDTEAPVLSCSNSITLTTNTLTGPVSSSYGSITCGATTVLPLPDADDNCTPDSGLIYDLDYPGGFVKNYKGQPVTLPMGINTVTFIVYDACYNSSTCDIIVEVVDNTPPVAVCDQYTVVSLTTGGTARVNATSFDDGSYDDCKDHCMLVRRMDPASCECNIPEFCDLNFIGERNGSYYYMSNYQITAAIAKSRASAYGGNLVVFETVEEENWLVSKIRQNNDLPFWIGMKAFGGGWLWDDHSPVSYFNWAPGKPTGGIDEDCVYISNTEKWVNTGCTNEYRYVLEIDDICGFSKTANFCCSDVGEDNMVVFRVVDVFGNYNDCMVNVEVQDKLAPTVICPPNQTVDCDTPFSIDNLGIIFGEASFLDDCGANIRETVQDSLNQCNIGKLTRIFTATDNGGRSSSCKQVITFENNMTFIDLSETVVCPRDTTIVGCVPPENLGPDVLGFPKLPADVCALVGADWDDELYTFNNFNGQACFKILRTWEIIDWCRQDPETGDFPVFTCQQVIKISNATKPEFTGSCDSLMVCTYDNNCADGFVELTMTGEDDCTEDENLRWRYRVYLGDLGEGPDNITGTPFIERSGVGDSINASREYPIGSHIIQWTFFDKCGNASTCNQAFTVFNCKAPTAYCISGLAVDLMPMDIDNDGQTDFGMVELWASDFDAGSSHPCGFDVILSFSPDTTEKNRIFDCTDIGDADVEIWVTVVDLDGNLIQSFCETFINVQDNMNACVGQSDVSVDVEGIIYTEDLETVELIDVNLDGSPLSTVTDIAGNYAFPEMPTGGDYVVNPYSNEAPVNGVSTLDILEIQKHILGIETLGSPYKIIAADVNNDNALTAKDLIDLRKLILGIHSDFPDNDSWRFVDKSYVFQDPVNPFREGFTEDYEIHSLNSNMKVDFIAVKVGDVNNSAQISGRENVDNRYVNTAQLNYAAGDVKSGDLVNIPVVLKNTELFGYQLSLEYDESMLEVIGLESQQGGFDSSNYRITGDGHILVSWNNIQSVKSGEELFRLIARAREDGNTANALNITTDIFTTEAYSNNETVDIAMNSVSDTESESFANFALYQNTPNPFMNTTEVSFELESDQAVSIKIHDVHGKLIKQINGNYAAGINTIQLHARDLNATGVLYLTLQGETQTASIKMVVLK